MANHSNSLKDTSNATSNQSSTAASSQPTSPSTSLSSTAAAEQNSESSTIDTTTTSASSQRTIRLAVLECDTPLPHTKERFGGYGGVFEFLLRNGLKSLVSKQPEYGNIDLQISKYQIENDPETYPDLEEIDAVLITGSRHDSFADTPWINKLVAYTRRIVAQERVRIIGVCFGHQIVGRAMDAQVGRNDRGWEAAVNKVQLTEKGKEIFGVDELNIHQMHRDAVLTLPSNTTLLGYSPVCDIQGYYIPKRIITVQGHPEFNKEIMEEILETRHATGIFNDEAYAAHAKKAPLEHDGVRVSRAFVKFLVE